MSVRLSHRSGEILGKLQRALRLPERPPLLRLALAQGMLAYAGELPHEDSRGPEIPLKVITGGQDTLMDALVVETLGYSFDATERKGLYKRLVDLGLSVMYQRFEQMNTATDFLVQIARQSVAS